MKKVKNISSLEEELFSENPNWKQVVYDQLGIWINIAGDSQGDWELVSACCPNGSVFLDDDGWYEDGSSSDAIELHSIKDLMDFILGMRTYHNLLKDISFGTFSKSDLFWAIENRILATNLNADGKIYGLSGIYGPDDPLYNDMKPGDLWLDFAVRALDQIPGIYLTKEHQTSIDAAIENIAGQLEQFRNEQNWTADDVPQFKFNAGATYLVPRTLEELVSAYHYMN